MDATTLACAVCGTGLFRSPGPGRLPKYCGKTCSGRAMARRLNRPENTARSIPRHCAECGAEFLQTKRGCPPLYCSAPCKRRAQARQRRERAPARTCKRCKRVFRPSSSSTGKYCSKTCYQRTAAVVSFTCERCGATAERKDYRPGRFCSRACTKAWSSEHMRQIQPAGTAKILALVAERGRVDRWSTCPICGKRFERQQLGHGTRAYSTTCSRQCGGKLRRQQTWTGRNSPLPWASCLVCRTPFVARKGHTLCRGDACRAVRQQEARRAFWRKVVEELRPVTLASCRQCGVEFTYRHYRRTKLYCSTKCSRKFNRGAISAESRAAQSYRRRAAKYGSGEHERFTRAEIFERDGWRCGICGKKVPRQTKWPAPQAATLDHIVPLAKGGKHVRANVQLAHMLCNSARREVGHGQLRLFG